MDQLGLSIRKGLVAGDEGPLAPQELPVRVGESIDGPLGCLLVRKGQVLAEAKDIGLMDGEAEVPLPAYLGEADAALQGPSILGMDNHMDSSRLVHLGLDPGIHQEPEGAQIPFGFMDQPGIHHLAWMEEDLAAHHLLPGCDMYEVRRAAEPVALMGECGIEDITDADIDAGDWRPSGFQFLPSGGSLGHECGSRQ